jgi:DNA-binding response OmpR family regulator
MNKIAVIEDDLDLFSLLKYNLEKEGFEFVGSTRGGGALELCARERPNLLLLDIMLPDSDGLEICKLLRRSPHLAQLPIIFLTAKAAETDRIIGLELGANDYIVKPFFMRELMTRIRVQLRPRGDLSLPLKYGGVELDRNQRRVWLDGKQLALTATEFRLLEFLMSRRGAVYSRGQLLDAVWGHDRIVTERTVDVYILRLRQRLDDDSASPRFIRSVRGFGYSFQDERPAANI